MTIPRTIITRRTALGGLIAAPAVLGGGANAQEPYPSRPIQLILPAGPGGTTDIAVRILAEKWRETLGQSVVVVNRPGAGGAIGADAFARMAPDGYNLMGAFDSLTVALPLVQKVAYDFDSFTYLNGFGVGAIYFVVKADSPWKTMGDFLKDARDGGKQLSYASYGRGVITHFTAERLFQIVDARLTYVTYRSSPEAAGAVMGGHVDMAVTAGTGGVADNPQMRIIAIAGDKRHPDLPNVPTLIEQGYPVSLEYISGLVAPAGLPDRVKSKLIETIDATNKRYARELTTELKRADLIYANIPGEEMLATWKERQKWFREVAPRLDLNRT